MVQNGIVQNVPKVQSQESGTAICLRLRPPVCFDAYERDKRSDPWAAGVMFIFGYSECRVEQPGRWATACTSSRFVVRASNFAISTPAT